MDPTPVSQVSLSARMSMLKRASSQSINADFLGEWESQSFCTFDERTFQQTIFKEVAAG